MFQRSFWTERRLTGATLLLGALLFLIGAFLPLTDTKGNFICTLQSRQWLQVIFDHLLLWQWANFLFISGAVVTVLGLVMLTRLLGDAGDRGLSQLGLITFALEAVFWVIIVAFRQSIDPWSAQEMVKTSALPDFYVPLTLWTHALGVIYTVLAFAALAAYGGAALSTHILPRGIGWFTLVYSLAGLGLFACTHDIPPFLHYLPPLVIGILLLLPRYQYPIESPHAKEPVADSMQMASERIF